MCCDMMQCALKNKGVVVQDKTRKGSGMYNKTGKIKYNKIKSSNMECIR